MSLVNEWLVQKKIRQHFSSLLLTSPKINPEQLRRRIETISENERFVLRLAVISPQPTSHYQVKLAEADVLYGLTSGAKLKVDYYTTDSNKVGIWESRISASHTESLESNETLMIHRERTVYRMACQSKGILISLIDKQSGVVSYNYCPKQKTLKNCQATSNQDSLVQFACTILSHFPNPKGVKILPMLMEHESYFVRWAALQAYAKIAKPEQVKKSLEAFLNDPHPHLENSAKEALKINF